MKVVEYLYEFEHKGWEVRVWVGLVAFSELRQYIANLSHEQKKTPVAFAAAIGTCPDINAVQVKYNKHESVLIYPDWP